jgi:pectate lyase
VGQRTETVLGPPYEYGEETMRSSVWGIVFFISLFFGATTAAAADPQKPLAFPGAEGYGRYARGGRGGDVYHVTTLADDGAGSLRDAIRSATDPRTIVFDLSGTIELKMPLIVNKSFVTIAGQTAPGDGICLKDWTFEIRKASHVIVRYLRVRLGDKNKAIIYLAHHAVNPPASVCQQIPPY